MMVSRTATPEASPYLSLHPLGRLGFAVGINGRTRLCMIAQAIVLNLIAAARVFEPF
jgi:hypothetical protein